MSLGPGTRLGPYEIQSVLLNHPHIATVYGLEESGDTRAIVMELVEGETLAGILMRQPDWSALPDDVPAAIGALLRRCLEKDRRRRIAEIAVALFALDEAKALESAPAPSLQARTSVSPPSTWRRVASYGALTLMAAAVSGTGFWFATRPTPPRVSRLGIMTTASTALTINGIDRDLTITPDGTRVRLRR